MKKNIIILFSTIIVICCFYLFMIDSMKKDIQIQSKQSLQLSKTAYLSIFDTYKVSARKDYQSIIENKKVISLLREFNNSNEKEKQIIRGRLYRLLYKKYYQLQSFNVRQFHFHTTKGESLLRFHSPAENGDPLINFRTSINIANTQYKPVFGFEGGRLYPGFRYVFPLMYNGEHLGSVEFSLSFEGIEKKLKTILPYYAHILLMDKSVTTKKVFQWNKKFFEESNLSKDYHVENHNLSKVMSKLNNNKLINKLDKIVKDDLIFKLKHKEHKSFSVPIITDNKGYIVTFVVLNNTDNDFAGYIVSYEKSSAIVNIKDKYSIFILLGILIIVLINILFYFLLKERKTTINKSNELEHLNNNLQKILDQQQNIIILNKNNNIYQVNEQFLNITGYKNLDTFKSRYTCICDLFQSDENNPELLTKTIFKDSLQNGDLNSVNNKTASFYNKLTKEINSYLVTVANYNNNKYEYIITLTNISELLKLQGIISTQSKISAVGDMLGNIAHQWRQPLSIITMTASSLKLSSELGMVPSTKEISSSVDNIVKQSEYLSEVINNFKDFFYHNSNKVTQINIVNSVNKIETIIKDSFFDNNIKYISDIEDCEILGNENTLTQALLNIYNNAFEAIISKTKSSKNRYFFVTLKKYDDQVKLTFKDSGGGISPHIINKVFEPYFSTKHASVGTGISLYMTHQLITKQLKGNITLHNSNYTYNDQKLKGIEVIITFNI